MSVSNIVFTKFLSTGWPCISIYDHFYENMLFFIFNDVTVLYI